MMEDLRLRFLVNGSLKPDGIVADSRSGEARRFAVSAEQTASR
jgi:hypothetical protein